MEELTIQKEGESFIWLKKTKDGIMVEVSENGRFEAFITLSTDDFNKIEEFRKG